MLASKYIEQLQQGKPVSFRPHGSSMRPRIESSQLVTVAPFSGTPSVGSIVLCKVEDRQWLHLVSAVGSDGRVQISNNHGHVNGWCGPNDVYGIVVEVGP